MISDALPPHASDEHFHVRHLRSVLPPGAHLWTRVQELAFALGNGDEGMVVLYRLRCRTASGAWQDAQSLITKALLDEIDGQGRTRRDSFEWRTWRTLVLVIADWLAQQGCPTTKPLRRET